MQNIKEQKNTTIKNITCYGDILQADSLIIADENDEHIIDNWHFEKVRTFLSWNEAVDYLIENYKFYGEIQEICID